MRGFGFIAAATFAALASTVVADVDPIVIKGSKFFYKTNGTQFFIRGIAYQQDYSGNGSTSGSNSYTDPLADSAGCQRDIPLLKQLQTNTIRVYAIDPTLDHSSCMQQLQDANIYVVLDLSSPGTSINRASPEWTDDLYARYTSVVDATANYTNILGYFAGNEVSNAPNNTDASAFVKAAVRDMKAYIKQKNYRTIGVGYATNDDSDIRINMADYFNCGDSSSSIDFWGYNIYSWCGNSDYETSGYADRTKEFSGYSVPAFFAEYGCNSVRPRPFSEVNAIFGSNMTKVWSGGIVYMYFEEANDYGLVSLSGNTVSKLADFTSLSSRMAAVTPTGVNSASYSPSNSAQACPSTGSSWNAVATPLPPTPNEELCSCMYNTLSCAVSPKVNADNYGDLFGVVCGYSTANNDLCAATYHYGNNATYGAYSMCNSTQQLSFVMNRYYLSQGKSADACSFGGSATVKSAASATGQCSTLIAEAGTAGTGTVTSQPTATGAGAAGSGGSGGAASSSHSKGAASGLQVHHGEMGVFGFGVYVFVAVLSAAAMIAL